MIIVTGANGFIGSVIVWELNQAGHKDIVCVDPIPQTPEHNLLKNRTISKFMSEKELLSFIASPDVAKKTTWVIHMGACSSTTETNWDFLRQNNTEYTQKLWQWCTTHNIPFIYASSAATYGDGKLGFSDETDSEKLVPLNLYGKSKLLFDQWALKEKNTPPHWYGLKFFNVFGPNELYKQSMSSVAFKAFNQIRETKELGLFKSHNPQYEDGKQLRDFVYVKDVTRWIRELIEKNPKSGIYNMGFGKARTWLDLAHSVFSALSLEPKIKWLEVPENIRNQYQYFTEADMTKWHRNGLSAPQWPLEKAVDDYVKNHLLKSDSIL